MLLFWQLRVSFVYSVFRLLMCFNLVEVFLSWKNRISISFFFMASLSLSCSPSPPPVPLLFLRLLATFAFYFSVRTTDPTPFAW